ncbi:hypothetical protein PENSPDRAFT_670392 [Peniophora sp. CONT]|nr:hypothetical protein PENSPDRAFT_670392 [Peniophora sp. CONT]
MLPFRYLFLIISLVYSALPSFAQDLSVPNAWQDPTVSLNRTERETLATKSIAVLTSIINSTSGQIDALTNLQQSNFISVLALNDLFTNSTNNLDVVTDSVNKWIPAHNSGFYTELILIAGYWGLAAIHAYRAYKQDFFLQTAKGAWQQVNQNFITTDDAQNGQQVERTANKPFPISRTCNGSTTAGGVFWIHSNPVDPLITGETVGGFMALSAYLLSATSDLDYENALEASISFVQSTLYNGTLIMDKFNISSCSYADPTNVATIHSGLVLEGISVYANVSKKTQWDPFLATSTQSLTATVISNPAFTTSNGIEWEGDGPPTNQTGAPYTLGPGAKGIFMRSLQAVWQWHGPQNTALANYIEAYMNVQFNAIQKLSGDPANYTFGPAWTGPAYQQLNPGDQSAAINVFNSAISMAPVTANSTSLQWGSSSTPSPSPTSNPSSSSPTSHIGAIVGGVVGGVGGLALLGLIAWFLRKRSKASHSNELADSGGETPPTGASFLDALD